MSYFGGKGGSGVPERLCNRVPRHRVRLIGFAGQCALHRKLPPCDLTILCDTDPAVCQWWEDRKPERTIIKNECGISVAQSTAAEFSGPAANDLFSYFDPPYPDFTRRSSHRYKCELPIAQHYELLKVAQILPGNVMLSTYPNFIYRLSLIEWDLTEYQSMTRGGNLATEWLFQNASPITLHDYRWLGSNSDEREKLKRRDNNLTRRLRELPRPERLRLLSAAINDNLTDATGIIEQQNSTAHAFQTAPSHG